MNIYQINNLQKFKQNILGKVQKYRELKNLQGLNEESLEIKEDLINEIQNANCEEVVKLCNVLIDCQEDYNDIGYQLIKQVITLILNKQSDINILSLVLADLVPFNEKIQDQQVELFIKYINKNMKRVTLENIANIFLAVVRLSSIKEIQNREVLEKIEQLVIENVKMMNVSMLNRILEGLSMNIIKQEQREKIEEQVGQLVEKVELISECSLVDVCTFINKLSGMVKVNDELWRVSVEIMIEKLEREVKKQNSGGYEIMKAICEIMEGLSKHQRRETLELQSSLLAVLIDLVANDKSKLLNTSLYYQLIILLSQRQSTPVTLWNSIAQNLIPHLHFYHPFQVFTLIYNLSLVYNQIPHQLWQTLENALIDFSHHYSFNQINSLYLHMNNHSSLTQNLSNFFEKQGCTKIQKN